MRIRLTLGVRCSPIIPCTAGRIRTRGTPLARKLPCCSKRLRDVAYHARAWKPTKHPFRSDQFTLPTYPQGAIRAAAYRGTLANSPWHQHYCYAIVFGGLTRRFRFSRRQFFHQIYRRSKIRPLQATRNGPQNALILMDLLYNKGEFLSSIKHRTDTPRTHNYYIKTRFTICSHIHIFAFFKHSVFSA